MKGTAGVWMVVVCPPSTSCLLPQTAQIVPVTTRTSLWLGDWLEAGARDTSLHQRGLICSGLEDVTLISASQSPTLPSSQGLR